MTHIYQVKLSSISPGSIFSENTQRDLSNDTLIIHIVCLPYQIYTNTFWLQLVISNWQKIKILMRIWKIWIHNGWNITKIMLLTFINCFRDIMHYLQLLTTYLNTTVINIRSNRDGDACSIIFNRTVYVNLHSIIVIIKNLAMDVIDLFYAGIFAYLLYNILGMNTAINMINISTTNTVNK